MRLEPIVAPSRVGHQWHTQVYDMFHLVQHNLFNQQFFAWHYREIEFVVYLQYHFRL